MASSAVRSNAVFQFPLFVGGGGFVFGICFVMHYLVPFPVLQSSCGERESWLLYFNCVLVVLSGTALPRGAVDGSAVCDCGISWSFDTSAVLVNKSQITGFEINRKSIEQTLIAIDTNCF